MKHKEDDLQMVVAKYLDAKNLLWCHIANERKTSKIAGSRLKKKGVKSGVPDCLIFKANRGYIGLAIELKIKPNKPSKNQSEWMHRLMIEGWFPIVCNSLDEVIITVDKYLNN